jgi:hypothetical protein
VAHQVVITDQDYAALADASARTGIPIEEFVHQAIAERLASFPLLKQIGTYTYPSAAPLTDEEDEEMERLAQEIGPGRPWASEIVDENRGPR